MQDGFNQEQYLRFKKFCESEIASKRQTPSDFMLEYKKRLKQEDYEACKAITEVLEPLKYYTKDTHAHIEGLR